MPSSSRPQDAAAIDRWVKALLESTSEIAVIILTVEGEILAWLGASEFLLGYSQDEAVGMPLSRLFTAEDLAAQLEKQERELALTAGRSEDDRWHVRKSGSRFWGSGVMEPVLGENGQVMALAKVLRDRTDVRTQVVTLQNRLLCAEEENANRLKTLVSLAHELRNQVSPLSNLLAALEAGAADSAATRSMRRQLQGMARLVDDLAQETASAAAPATLRTSLLEAQAALLHAADGMAAAVAQRGQTLKVTLPDTPILFEADADRVDQILGNLLSNASKYTQAGGTIQLSTTVEDDVVAIRVEDDGQGIPVELLPKIFELFTRQAGPDAPHGLGVGLSVVKMLAELHGGFVEGRSPGVGKGSVFTVRLPLVQPKVDASPA
ncbi:MAG: chemotaxis protein methyltransferase CheR [Rhizobacter sp.]|nr:chemotaxis protein methyltransferase CheR [Rhizobacter sp.]